MITELVCQNSLGGKATLQNDEEKAKMARMWAADVREFITDFKAPPVDNIRHSRRGKWCLRRTLNDGQWHSFDNLKNAMHWGDSDGNDNTKNENTRRLLRSIDARNKQENQQEFWSLDLPTSEFEQVRKRATFLYEQAGKPANPDLLKFWGNAEKHFYEKNGKIYLRDGSQNIKEALGFTKDWVTSLVGLDTAAIGAIGAFISLKDFPTLHLSWFE
jgi:hypothetical protein